MTHAEQMAKREYPVPKIVSAEYPFPNSVNVKITKAQRAAYVKGWEAAMKEGLVGHIRKETGLSYSEIEQAIKGCQSEIVGLCKEWLRKYGRKF
jgi:hypothetical protein